MKTFAFAAVIALVALTGNQASAFGFKKKKQAACCETVAYVQPCDGYSQYPTSYGQYPVGYGSFPGVTGQPAGYGQYPGGFSQYPGVYGQPLGYGQSMGYGQPWGSQMGYGQGGVYPGIGGGYRR